MKKILAVALVLCLVLAVAPMAFADNPVVKIGVFEPQSGERRRRQAGDPGHAVCKPADPDRRH